MVGGAGRGGRRTFGGVFRRAARDSDTSGAGTRPPRPWPEEPARQRRAGIVSQTRRRRLSVIIHGETGDKIGYRGQIVGRCRGSLAEVLCKQEVEEHTKESVTTLKTDISTLVKPSR